MAKRRVNAILAVFGCVLAVLLGLAATPSQARAASGSDDISGYISSSYSGKQHFNSIATLNKYMNEMEGQITIDVENDASTTAAIVIPLGKTVTINLNGHILNRHLASLKSSSGSDTDTPNSSKSESNGEVINVSNLATVTINGGDATVPHKGRIVQSYFWFEDETYGTSAGTLYGGIIAGGYSTNSGGGIHMQESSVVTLNNVTIAGNMADEYWGDGIGGGVCLGGKNCTLYMNNSRICYNYAEDWGGGIGGKYEKGTVNIDPTSAIDHNRSDKYGGGVYGGQNFLISGSSTSDANGNVTAPQIHHNKSKYGGGVYLTCVLLDYAGIASTASIVSGVNINYNTATKWGGGVFVDGGGCSVTGCTITYNDAQQGGGIYFNANKCSLASSSVTNNHASEFYGGGVYVSSVDNLSISGVLVVKDNTAYNSKKSQNVDNNLHLGHNALKAYIDGNPSPGSEVHIYSEHSQLSKTGSAYDATLFKSDTGETVTWSLLDEKGNYDRYLRLDGYTSTSKAEKQTVSVSSKTTVKNSDGDITYAQWEGVSTDDYYLAKDKVYYLIYSGYTSYPTVEDSTNDYDIVYHYTDGFFAQDATVYNTQLATMSATLAMSAFGANDGNYGTTNKTNAAGDYTNKSAHVKQLLSDIGCEDEDIYISDTFTTKPGTDTIACAIGQKKIKTAETGVSETYTLVPIAIRGGGYESEWVSNVTLGTSGEAEGFANAADQVKAMVDTYIKDYGLSEAVAAGTVKFWVVGYSRAGATANLTAKRLIDSYGVTGTSGYTNQVYGYTIEAPQGANISTYSSDTAWQEAQKTTYASIHNIVNRADPVTMVGPSAMGFRRYGVDHYLPGGDTASTPETKKDSTGYSLVADNDYWAVQETNSYNTQRKLMLKQLAAIQPGIVFDDYFSLATANLLGSATYWNMFEAISDGNISTREEWLPYMLQHLQQQGYRSKKATKKEETAVTDPQTLRTYYATGLTTSYGYRRGKVSAQEAARIAMSIVMGELTADDKTNLTNALSGITSRLDTGDMWDVYSAIRYWDECDDSYKDERMELLWNALITADARSAGITAYLTTDQVTRLHNAFYGIADLMLNYVAWDYDAENLYDTSGNNKDYAVDLGTLGYNAATLIQPHYWEVSLAWIRSYDSLYTNDVKQILIDRKVTATNPTVKGVNYDGDDDLYAPATENDVEDAKTLSGSGTKVDPYVLTGTATVHLEAKGQRGAELYYSLDEGATWSLYQNGIVLASNASSSTTYTVKTYSKYYRNKSNEVTYTFTVNGSYTLKAYSQLPDDNGAGLILSGSYTSGQQIKITAPDKSGYTFWKWEVKDSDTGVDKTSEVFTESTTTGDIRVNNCSITMPEYNVTVTARYVKNVSDITIMLNAATEGTTFPTSATMELKRDENTTVELTDDQKKDVSISWSQETTGGYTLTATIWGNNDTASESEPYLFNASYDKPHVKIKLTPTASDDDAVYASSATRNADGALVVTYTVLPTISIDDSSAPAAIKVPFGTSFEDLPLPTVMLGTASYSSLGSTKETPIAVPVDWSNAKSTYDSQPANPGEAQELTGYATITDADGAKVWVVIEVTVKAEETETPATPTPTKDAGNYSDTVMLGLECTTKDAKIGYNLYYRDSDGTQKKVAEGATYTEGQTLELTAPEIADKATEDAVRTYTLKVWSSKTYKTKIVQSPVATYTYVITKSANSCTVTLECYDANAMETKGYAEEGEALLSTQSFIFAKGESISQELVAPNIQGATFYLWDATSGGEKSIRGNSDYFAVAGNTSNTSSKITMTKLTGNVTLRLYYIPVVSEVDIALEEPKAGEELATALNGGTVTVLNNELKTETLASSYYLTPKITWSPNDTTAAYGTEYTATISLDWDSATANGHSSSPSYRLYTDSTVVKVNGEEVTAWSTTGEDLIITFPATNKLKVTEVQTPNAISVGSHTDEATIVAQLPAVVTLKLSDGSTTGAAVSGWTLSSETPYDKESAAAQTLTYTGTITYPDSVEQNDQSETVSVTVNVEAAEKAATPTANYPSGTYSHSVTVTLSCADGATIYYTTDGSDPVVGTSTSCASGAELTFTEDTTLKAVAVQSGLNQSNTLVRTYTIDKRYALSVKGGADGTTAISTAKYAEGTTVTISAPSLNNYAFWKWVAVDDEGNDVTAEVFSAESASTTDVTTTLTMPDHNVTVTAKYASLVTTAWLDMYTTSSSETFPTHAVVKLARYTGGMVTLPSSSEVTSVAWAKDSAGGYTLSVTLLPCDDANGVPVVYASNISASFDYGKTTINETTVTHGADGSITVSYTVKPTITAVEDPSAISVDYNTVAEDLPLPTSVLATVNYEGLTGTVTEARKVMWDTNCYSATKTDGAQTLTGTVDGKDAGGNKVTTTIAVTVNPEVVQAPEVPTATPDGGNFSTSQSVSLKCATPGAEIHYKVNDGTTTSEESVYSEAITLEAPAVGETKTYTVTAWSESTGTSGAVGRSSEATFTYVISKPYGTYTITVECVDVNYQAAGATDKMVVGTRTYVVQGGDNLNYALIAPNATDEVFMSWADVSDTNITLGDEKTSKARTVSSLTGDVTIRAIYKPVVKSAVVDLEAPTTGSALAAEVGKKTSVTITNTFDAAALESMYDLVFDDVTWIPAAPTSGNADYNTAYTAVVSLSKKDGSNKSIPLFAYSDEGVSVKLAGKDQPEVTARIEEGKDGLPVLYISFPATDKAKVKGVTAPSDITVAYGTAQSAIEALLPQTVAATTEAGTATVTVSGWTLQGRYADSTAGQTLTYKGQLSYPDSVDAVNAATEVEAKVVVAAADHAAAPTASKDSGTYNGPLSVELSAETGATIYYTTDGTEPTTSSTVYDGAISLAVSSDPVTLKAIAVVPGKQASAAMTRTYTVVEPAYRLTALTEAGETVSALMAGEFHEGDSVALNAPAIAGYTFWKWVAEDASGIVTEGVFANGTDAKATTSIAMPASDVTVTATYAKLVDSIMLDLGTASSGFPTTGEVSLKRGSEVVVLGKNGTELVTSADVSVAWDQNPAGGYTLSATLYPGQGLDAAGENAMPIAFVSSFESGAVKVNLGGVKENATATKNADGSVTISHTVQPTVTSVTNPADVTVSYGTSADKLGLPTTVVVEVNYASYGEATETRVVQWATDAYNATKTGEPQSITGAVDGTDKTATIKVTVESEVIETPKAPKASVASGNYNSTQSVELVCATEGTNIYYSLDGGTTTYEYKGAIELAAPTATTGGTKVYTLTAWAEKTGASGSKASSAKATYVYVITKAPNTYSVTVECVDYNYACSKDVSEQAKQVVEKHTYLVQKGEGDYTLIAPSAEDEIFMYWKTTDLPNGITATEDSEGSRQLKISSLTSDVTIQAFYQPAVKEIDLDLDLPSAGELLPNDVGDNTSVTVTDTFTKTQLIESRGLTFSVTWAATGTGDSGVVAESSSTTAGYNTIYTATIRLMKGNGSWAKFGLGANIKVKLNGEEYPATVQNLGTADDPDYVLIITFPATAKAKVTGTTEISGINVSHGTKKKVEAAIEEALPCEVEFSYQGSFTKGKASVKWTLEDEGYNEDSLETQTLTYVGTLTYPDDVDVPSKFKTVTTKVYVAGADQVAMPTASQGEGTYTKSVAVSLSCKTEGATIYYTTDGSEPSTNSTEYTGAFELEKTTTVKAIAVKDGMRTSNVFSATYTINAGGGDTPVTPTTTYTITASAGANGSISPSGAVKVASGASKSFTITPADGYRVADVLVDGKSVGAVSSYKFTNVKANHTIAVTFEAGNTPADPEDTGVSDLLNTTDHVAFMTGYADGSGLFGPDATLTRAQCAQVFYNLLRNKNVKAGAGYSDVASGAWYAKPVLAMQSLGIMTGVGDTGCFEPDRAITRAEFATVCARFAKVATGVQNPFKDVADDAWYAKNVTTAYAYGWFDGNGSTGLFEPERSITRAEAAKVVGRMLGRSADKAYVDAHAATLRTFPDVTKSHWAYYYVAEAANAHDYTKASGAETWK